MSVHNIDGSVASRWGRYHLDGEPDTFYHETKPDTDGDLASVRKEVGGDLLLFVRSEDGHHSVYLDEEEAYHLALAILTGHGLLLAQVPTTDGMNAVVLRVPNTWEVCGGVAATMCLMGHTQHRINDTIQVREGR